MRQISKGSDKWQCIVTRYTLNGWLKGVVNAFNQNLPSEGIGQVNGSGFAPALRPSLFGAGEMTMAQNRFSLYNGNIAAVAVSLEGKDMWDWQPEIPVTRQAEEAGMRISIERTKSQYPHLALLLVLQITQNKQLSYV